MLPPLLSAWITVRTAGARHSVGRNNWKLSNGSCRPMRSVSRATSLPRIASSSSLVSEPSAKARSRSESEVVLIANRENANGCGIVTG
eukprot:3472315-Pleurochrysis_carterae.AAC.2